jgi:hypothetical protein
MSRTATEGTKQNYLKNLIRLNDGNEIKNFNFLKKTEDILQKISHLKPNSQRTYLIGIVSTLKDLKGFEPAHKLYYGLMMDMNKALKDNTTKSATQTANWINQDEVMQRYQEMSEQVIPLLHLKKVNAKQWVDILDFIVFSLYTLQQPRRNKDYQLMLVIKSNKDFDDNYKEFNYWMGGCFLFYNYKTKGTYNLQDIPVNPELQEILKLYVRLHPLKKQKKYPLLVDYEGNPLLQVNDITRILNRIFKKKIGVSMLRNIYLTDKFKEPMQELKDTARAMGTSSNTIQNNYVKVDDTLPPQYLLDNL